MTANAGTSDDCVGDKDEDDEFMRQDTERRHRNVIKTKRVVRDKAQGIKKRNLKPRRMAAGRDKVVVKRSRRGVTKLDDVIYWDSDVDDDDNKGEGQGGKSGSSKAKDYDNNNRVEDDVGVGLQSDGRVCQK